MNQTITLALQADNLNDCKLYLASLHPLFWLSLTNELKAVQELGLSEWECKLNLFLVAGIQAMRLNRWNIAKEIGEGVEELWTMQPEKP